MGELAAAEIDRWLHSGGLVVTASDRAARAIAAAFHRTRRSEGFSAWPAPHILDWKSFLQRSWRERAADARLVLSAAQEEALWGEIAGRNRSLATLLPGPRHRLATLAMQAHELLCSHAPQFLLPSARIAWQQDAAAFSGWLTAFDELCRTESLLSASRLCHELIPCLVSEPAQRPPLLLAGFDRILPAQRSLLNAWGEWRETAQNAPAAAVSFYAAEDAPSELAACAIWCSRQLAANPAARLLVITQAASTRRGEIARAFRRHCGADFEFSLGVPLSQIALTRATHLLLRWLTGPLAEHELDWLLSTSYAGASQQECASLQAVMRALRRFGLERTHWTLADFLGERCTAELLPIPWAERVKQAQLLLTCFTRRPQTPLDWAELLPRLLDELHFAKARSLTSNEFQALRRWRQTVESCGSLGFDGRRISWMDFLSELSRALDETLYAPESSDASILIAGPAESAGLTADAVWFLGAEEDSWPASGTTHPLLPVEVQREAGMPHATAQLDWELAAAVTRRLLASANQIHFSYARQNQDAEARPSRLILHFAGPALPLPPELTAPAAPEPLTVSYEDRSRIPFPPGKVKGGAAILTAQSQCPFKAFATVRLGAQSWEQAQPFLTPSQRGNLLHAVLRAIWDGPPQGIRSHADLLDLSDREAFIASHVQRTFAQKLPAHLRKLLPSRYLELEEQRLTGLLTEWLEYEGARVEFNVVETEAKRTIQIDGLDFDLRLDRLDRLSDGSLLVIDYKSGDLSTSAWELPRPDDVQLPLYAGFALDANERLGGLVFAKVRPGEMKFSGHVSNASGTLFAGLKGTNPLVKNPFTSEQLQGWRDCIEQLAKDFLAGHAEVDPREAPKTCERCGLQTLCRIQETASPSAEDDSTGEEAAVE